MDRREDQRAADTDREAVAGRLRQAVDEGRLDLYEYDERLRQAYTAKTYGELDRVLVDLPSAAPEPASPPRRPVVRPWLAAEWSGWARVVTICVAIWLFSVLASGGFTYFWPVWVAGPWGAILLFRTAGGLASGEPHRWAERRADGRRTSEPSAEGDQRDAVAAAGGTRPAVAGHPTPRRGCC